MRYSAGRKDCPFYEVCFSLPMGPFKVSVHPLVPVSSFVTQKARHHHG